MGTGHLMRCLALAECLRDRGAQVRFICRAHPGNMIGLLRDRGMQVAELPAAGATTSPKDEEYPAWLGATQTEDAIQTAGALGDERPGWLLVDHYGIDAAWEGAMRPHAAKVLVIDDLANRRHDCDTLLDQNFSERGADRYIESVPEHCAMLLGPRYALLRPEYADHRRSAPRRVDPVRRVFVFFGGSDPDNVTGRALEALSVPSLSHLEVDIVAGTNNPHRALLEQQAADRPGTRLHGQRPHLADVMARADVAIGAGGATTWERMCLGLPSLVVSIAGNQVPACEALARAGMIRYLGSHDTVDVTDLRSALEAFMRPDGRLAEQACDGQAAVDGLGARRVAEVIVPTPASELSLRRADADDVYQYFDWVNDPEVRRQSLRSEPVSLAQHRQWFAEKLAGPDSRLFVLEAAGLPVGQVRFDRIAGETLVDYSIERPFRGRGWARRLVALGLHQMRGHGPAIFRAEVKASNLPSCAVFRSLEFVDGGSRGKDDIRVFWLDSGTHG